MRTACATCSRLALESASVDSERWSMRRDRESTSDTVEAGAKVDPAATVVLADNEGLAGDVGDGASPSIPP